MSLGAVLIILANTWIAAAFVMLSFEAWWGAAAASGIGFAFTLMNAGLRVHEVRAAAWPDRPAARQAEHATAKPEHTAAPKVVTELRAKLR